MEFSKGINRDLLTDVKMLENGLYPSNIVDGWEDEDPTEAARERKWLAENRSDFIDVCININHRNPCCQ
jgi:hypothetical protein